MAVDLLQLVLLGVMGVAGAAGYIAIGFSETEDLLSLPPLMAGSMIGAPFGVQVRELLSERAVRGVFVAFMVVVALRLLSEALGLF